MVMSDHVFGARRQPGGFTTALAEVPAVSTAGEAQEGERSESGVRRALTLRALLHAAG